MILANAPEQSQRPRRTCQQDVALPSRPHTHAQRLGPIHKQLCWRCIVSSLLDRFSNPARNQNDGIPQSNLYECFATMATICLHAVNDPEKVRAYRFKSPSTNEFSLLLFFSDNKVHQARDHSVLLASHGCLDHPL